MFQNRSFSDLIQETVTTAEPIAGVGEAIAMKGSFNIYAKV